MRLESAKCAARDPGLKELAQKLAYEGDQTHPDLLKRLQVPTVGLSFTTVPS